MLKKIVWKYPTLRDQLSIAIGVLALLALICLFFVQKLNASGKRAISIITIAAGVLALVTASTAWAMTPIEYGGSVTKPFAGPELKNQHERDGMASNPP